MFKLNRGNGREEVAVTVSTETFIRLALLTVGTVVLLVAVHKAAHALLLIFIAFFFALALNAPVAWVAKLIPGKKKGSRAIATSVCVFVALLLVAGFIASISPPLVRQTNNFIKAAPDIVSDFRSQDSETGRLIRRYHLQKQVDTFSEQLSDRIKNSGGTAFSTAQRIGTSAFSLLTIIVLTFMMLVEGPRWITFGRKLIPDKHDDATERITSDMYKVIQGFVNGQVILAALAAILIMPAILILNISYPIALMVIVFVCGLIPMVGHTIGAIIVTTVALFESTSAAIIILAYYILYQQLENILIQPRIQANSTNMSPLLVFAAVVIGISFGGLVGGLLAIPLAGCIRIVLLDYLRSQNIISSEYKKSLTTDTKS